MELGHWPTRWSKIAPDKTVIKYGDLSLNWNEFNTRINQAAHAIQAAGMKKGDRLAVLLGNSNVFLEVFFAAAKLGVIFVPLNFRLSPPELAYQINETHPKILVYAPEFKELVNALKETCPEVSTWVCETAMGPADELVFESWIDSSPAAEPMPDSPVGMDDAVMIMYTSGTTGRPKGAVLSHGNIAWNSINAQHFNAYKGHEISLCNAPLFHIGAFNVIAMPFLYAGCRLVLQRFFEPAEALRLIESEKVTTMFGVPVMFQLMMNVPRWPDCDLSHVIYFISGGAPCPPVLIDAYLQKGVRFVQGYGMTESAAGVSMLAPQQASNKPGSAGVPLFHLQLAVVGRQGDHLGPGEIGEIWIKGPNVFSAYWRMPEASAASFKDEWFCTGDMGYLDPDGFLYITDRKMDMYISGGENVYPAEVERILSNYPLVAEVAVIGVADDKWGEVGVAVIHPKDADGSFSEDAFFAFCKDNLAGYKRPRKIIISKEPLPKTPTGKLVKKDLRQLLDR